MADSSGSTRPEDSEKLNLDWNESPKLAASYDPSEDFTCKASQAFDHWFACITVGKQLSNYYRYGEKRGCSKHWDKFKLCMAMKIRSEESGKTMMREFKAKQQAERDSQPNVMDVWTVRK
ncbi:hypothetical protein H4R99_001444 [Coemansia sp. RSA 1722]|nr:hypothetical protein LPJ57_007211 [Coemansia sp. RSA 486]KAJ2604971.1 hypothetical protein H4R99_001444 [Coemansia sp. RSA 1722]